MKQSNPMKQPIRAILFGLLSAVLSFAMSLLFAKLILNGSVPLEQLPKLSVLIHAVSALAGCLLSALTAKERKLLYAALTGAVYFLILCIANGFLLRGEIRTLPLTATVVAAAALLSGLLSAKKKKRY